MNRLRSLLTDVFGVSEKDLQDDRTLDDMGLDSISIVEFQIEVERAFNIDSGQLALATKDTLQSIMERVRGLQNAKLKGA
ncbi:acyl carrier protein [Citrobacter gillenii]|jgi:acyl carrier protein|uniref:acyl carrier protein n=1 Tax=Citrobacter gillenii TaxID=67828 RepID=UPI00311CC472